MDYAIYIYLYTVLKTLIGFGIFTSLVGAFLTFIVFMEAENMVKDSSSIKERDEKADALRRKALKLFLLVAIPTTLLFVLIPGKEDMKLILGGTAAFTAGEYAINSEEAQKLPDNVLKAMNQFLENVQEEKE